MSKFFSMFDLRFIRELITVTLGVLIAFFIGSLKESYENEKTVASAIENFRSELEGNKEALQKNIEDTKTALETVKLRLSTGEFEDSSSGSRVVVRMNHLRSAAWTTAKVGNVLHLLSFKQINKFARIYDLQSLRYDIYTKLLDAVNGSDNPKDEMEQLDSHLSILLQVSNNLLEDYEEGLAMIHE